MNSDLINTITIIIPVKPGGFVAASQHLRQIMPEGMRYEILIAEGCSPSQQRNQAARMAHGDVLYFVDDDALMTGENLAICSEKMKDPAVAAVGGPSITPAQDNWLQQLFGSALASPFGAGAVRNRYRVSGEPRETTEKELILCNLAVRRQVFSAFNGFNECLYPNEENEFLDRVISAGYKLLHVPSMFVLRSQRETLVAFIRQMFNYGRGRGQQSIIASSYPLTSFIPLFFVAYLVFLLVCVKNLFLFIPLVIYLFAAIASSLVVLYQTRQVSTLLLIGLYPLMHSVNGLGLLWGLIRGKPAPVHDSSIRIRRIKRLGEKFCNQPDEDSW